MTEFLAASRELPLSYAPIGLATQTCAGFAADEHTATVGHGGLEFERAKVALSQWRHFELEWIDVFPRRAPTAPGSVVAILVRHLGFWSINACRVVYTVGARDGEEFGFAYGTLTDHAASGEELFKVSLNPRTGDVSYLIRAVSKPQAAFAFLGYPLTRWLQARFRRESARALAKATAA